jgi:hypothetical protein
VPPEPDTGPPARSERVTDTTELDLDAILKSATRLRGLNSTAARLIHHYSSAVYHLPVENIVVRITPGTAAYRRITLACRLVGWLVEQHGFPATAPAPGLEPVEVNGSSASFWRYYPQPADGPLLTSAHLGDLLRRLHDISDQPPVTPELWVPLASLHDALTYPATTTALSVGQRRFLLDEIHRVREQLRTLDWPLGHGLIHGDAWAGNLLHGTARAARVILTDWDWISHGPREIDLIPTWHAAQRYGRGPRWAAAFVDRYGHDLSTWPGFTTLMRMRDLVQVTGPLRRATTSPTYARALHQRIDGIRTADTEAVWTAL